MKKLNIFLVSLICSISFSNTCTIIEQLAQSRANKINKTFNLDKTTKYKIDKIEYMLSDVLKTDKQLIPKHCWYIAITTVKNEEFEVAKTAIEVAILANSTINPNLNVFIENSQEAKDKIVKLAKKYDIKNIYFYNDTDKLVENILKIKGDKKTLDHRRILLLTSSKTMRVEYSKLVNSLEDNKENMVIDNFAYLYKASRDKYEFSTKEEILNSYRQIKCK